MTHIKKLDKKKNTDTYDTFDDNINNKNDDESIIFSLIRNSLEYYDKYQPEIQKIIDKIEYIKIIDGVNINDIYVFYDSNDKEIFRSRIETLSIFIPQTNTWKWSWSVPITKYNNTLIARKILEYAFTLNTTTDFILKSSLINSNIIITNQNQIDIYLSLSSMLSKKPFILKIYLVPFNKNKNKDNDIYYFKDINNHPNKENFISIYSYIVDWNS